MQTTLTRSRPLADKAPQFPSIKPAQRIGMDMVPPYSVYIDGNCVAEYDTEEEASKHFNRLRARPSTTISGPASATQAVDRVTQNADGEWMLDGEVVRCSLGGHEGKARHLLLVKQFHEADAAGRARLLAEWTA